MKQLDSTRYSEADFLSSAEVSDADVGALRFLLEHLRGRETQVDLYSLKIGLAKYHLAVVREQITTAKSIVGTASLIPLQTASGWRGLVEDVVVHPDHQRQGIGRALMRCLLRKADALYMEKTALTSAPRRVAARALYEDLGFSVPNTTYFVRPHPTHG